MIIEFLEKYDIVIRVVIAVMTTVVAFMFPYYSWRERRTKLRKQRLTSARLGVLFAQVRTYYLYDLFEKGLLKDDISPITRAQALSDSLNLRISIKELLKEDEGKISSPSDYRYIDHSFMVLYKRIQEECGPKAQLHFGAVYTTYEIKYICDLINNNTNMGGHMVEYISNYIDNYNNNIKEKLEFDLKKLGIKTRLLNLTWEGNTELPSIVDKIGAEYDHRFAKVSKQEVL